MRKKIIVAVEVDAASEAEAFQAVDIALKVASFEDGRLGQVFVRAAVATDDVAYPILRRRAPEPEGEGHA